MGMIQERKSAMRILHEEDVIVSDTMYNGILGGTIAWGIIVNVFLCYFCTDFIENVNPLVFIIGYFVCAFSGIAISSYSKSPFISFLGYNLVVVPVGLVIASAVKEYGGIDSEVVFLAFLFTMIITACMIGLSIIYPRFFARLGGLLCGCLIGLILCEVVSALLGFNTYWYAWIGAAIFSLYIGYDYYVAQQYVKTVDNAVDSAVAIYLDIANLFLKLLRILGKRDD